MKAFYPRAPSPPPKPRFLESYRAPLTKEEIEELKAYQAPPSRPTEPPSAPELVISPPFAEVQVQASVNGRDLDKASQEVAARYVAFAKRIASVSPETHAAILGEREKIAAATVKYHALISETFGAIIEIETALFSRVTAKQNIQAKTAQLAEATATLESPDSLRSSGEELLVLQTRVKFLPTEIAELTETISGFEATIEQLAAANGFSVPALVRAIVARGRAADDRPTDHHHGFSLPAEICDEGG